uniref:Brix domain-containing protein n=1 Tax=Bicosoecida sp. CB-2014 TaxID=1486930 RepID=A0A7S1GC65_9STRA|mmetsp:Transcript_6243/g.22194  ORF Transcript_6243/g.22194 Transcript_6243/m.22194 type:complete len:323 (+) Transcript_6243:100-1068(+)
MAAFGGAGGGAAAGGGAVSLRRGIRQRKEYLYRRGLEGEARSKYEAKQAVREALRDGRPIPTELRGQEAELRREIEAEDGATGARPGALGATEVGRAARSALDDEYALAGVADPRVCVTTSHSPSSRLKQFAKEVRLLFPGAQRVNRGGHTTAEVVDACRRGGFSDLVVVNETRGEPDALIVSHLPFGPTVHFSLSNVVMRHDIEGVGSVSEAHPHLIFHGFSTQLGERIKTVLKHLFPVPKEGSKRVMTFANDRDFISFRHHTYEKERSSDRASDVTLHECGPRFEMRPFRVALGTVDERDAEEEWHLRPFMNTAARRTAL